MAEFKVGDEIVFVNCYGEFKGAEGTIVNIDDVNVFEYPIGIKLAVPTSNFGHVFSNASSLLLKKDMSQLEKIIYDIP